MLDWFKECAENAPPFMVAAMGATKGQLQVQRVVEAIIIAVASAGAIAAGGVFVAWPVMQSELAQIKAEVREVKAEVREGGAEIVKLRERMAGTESDVRHLQGRPR